MLDNDVTFIIFTYNEEKRIERVIKNFLKYGKIIVADNKSTDNTVHIARSYGCSVYNREKSYVFVENQELVDNLYKQINTEWIYWAFADEMVDNNTLLELKKVISLNKYDVINLNRKNYFEGRFCHDVFHSRSNKAFKKGAIDFNDNRIHAMGKVVIPGHRVYNMPNKYFVHNFSSNTASNLLNTINKYTEEEYVPGDTNMLTIFSVMKQLVKRIVKNYIFQGGYKAGYRGLQFILSDICYEWFKDLKIYEKKNQISRSKIEEIYNMQRDKILSEIK